MNGEKGIKRENKRKGRKKTWRQQVQGEWRNRGWRDSEEKKRNKRGQCDEREKEKRWEGKQGREEEETWYLIFLQTSFLCSSDWSSWLFHSPVFLHRLTLHESSKAQLESSPCPAMLSEHNITVAHRQWLNPALHLQALLPTACRKVKWEGCCLSVFSIFWFWLESSLFFSTKDGHCSF